MSRVEEVRLADCWRNGYEVHLTAWRRRSRFRRHVPRIEGKGFAGHYMNAFGSLDDMLSGRDDLVRRAAEAGIDC